MGVAEVLCVFYFKKVCPKNMSGWFDRLNEHAKLRYYQFFAKCKGGVGPIEPSANCGGIYVSNIGLCIQIDGYQIT